MSFRRIVVYMLKSQHMSETRRSPEKNVELSREEKLNLAAKYAASIWETYEDDERAAKIALHQFRLDTAAQGVDNLDEIVARVRKLRAEPKEASKGTVQRPPSRPAPKNVTSNQPQPEVRTKAFKDLIKDKAGKGILADAQKAEDMHGADALGIDDEVA
jgi:hypothetical protein